MSPYRVAAVLPRQCDHPGRCDWFCSPIKRTLVATTIIVLGAVIGVINAAAAQQFMRFIEGLQ